MYGRPTNPIIWYLAQTAPPSPLPSLPCPALPQINNVSLRHIHTIRFSTLMNSIFFNWYIFYFNEDVTLKKVLILGATRVFLPCHTSWDCLWKSNLIRSISVTWKCLLQDNGGTYHTDAKQNSSGVPASLASSTWAVTPAGQVCWHRHREHNLTQRCVGHESHVSFISCTSQLIIICHIYVSRSWVRK